MQKLDILLLTNETVCGVYRIVNADDRVEIVTMELHRALRSGEANL